MSTAQPTGTKGAAPARRSPFRPHGLGWLAWRQSRAAIWLSGGVLLATLALLAAHLWMQWQDSRIPDNCAPVLDGWLPPACRGSYSSGPFLAHAFTGYAEPAIFLLPVLIGMVVGAPLLSTEYERGTIRLVRAQSVAPTRWLAARLAVPALLVLVSVGALSAVSTSLWYWDIHLARFAFDPPFQGMSYPALGVAPLAWSLYALAVGVALGQLLRRTLVSVLATGVVVALSQLLVHAVRVHFLPITDGLRQNAPGQPALFREPVDGWLVGHGWVLPDASHVTEESCWTRFEECTRTGLTWGRYHPPSHFVPMQLVEAGLLAAVAGAALYVTFRRVARSAV